MPMMGGAGIAAMFLWMLFGMVLFIVLTVIIVWFIIHWLHTKEHSPADSMSQHQQMYREYEQGYQFNRPAPPMPKDGLEPYQNAQEDQPQVLYPQEQRMPEQR